MRGGFSNSSHDGSRAKVRAGAEREGERRSRKEEEEEEGMAGEQEEEERGVEGSKERGFRVSRSAEYNCALMVGGEVRV